MRNLEEQENLENQENIETTYQKSPAKVLRGGESPMSEEVLKASDEMHDALEAPKEFSTKSLLGSSHQAVVQTQSQIEAKVSAITEILDIDSNVINYGQFICGKILGSTLLLSNISKEDQIVTMNISKEKTYPCDTIFGQYNREELPFSYKDGTFIKNSEIEFNCWFIENPVSKEL